jgi:hypothetical protein
MNRKNFSAPRSSVRREGKDTSPLRAALRVLPWGWVRGPAKGPLMRSSVFWGLVILSVVVLGVLLYPTVEFLVKPHSRYFVVGHFQGAMLLLLLLVALVIGYSARRL